MFLPLLTDEYTTPPSRVKIALFVFLPLLTDEYTTPPSRVKLHYFHLLPLHPIFIFLNKDS